MDKVETMESKQEAVGWQEAGTTAAAQASLELNDSHSQEEGYYHLWRQGNQMTTSLVGQRIEAAHRKLLLTVPEGFRPSAPVQWQVTGHRLGLVDGQRTGLRVELTSWVMPNGAVHQSLAVSPEPASFLRYATEFTWITDDPLFSVAGSYRNWHVPMHLNRGKGVYLLERRGSQVWAT